jgi:hypothetical protein
MKFCTQHENYRVKQVRRIRVCVGNKRARSLLVVLKIGAGILRWRAKQVCYSINPNYTKQQNNKNKQTIDSE